MTRYFLLLTAASVLHAADLRVAVENNEVWLTRDGQSKQLTRDGKAKWQADLAPDGSRIAYYEQCPESERCTPSVVILDLDGKRLQSFHAPPGALGDTGPCTSILRVAWVGTGAVGVECHGGPSTSGWAEIDLATGRTLRSLAGIFFTPSPDGKRVAHVGPLIHFAPPFAKSYVLMFDDVAVYPPSKDAVPNRGRTFTGIHEFGPRLSWSPDSRRVAFVDCMYDWVAKEVGSYEGDEVNRRCSLAVVSTAGAFQLFPLAGAPLQTAAAWTGNDRLEFGGTTYAPR